MMCEYVENFVCSGVDVVQVQIDWQKIVDEVKLQVEKCVYV